VLVSRADGPATWGVWRTHVVVPFWVLELGVRARRMIMLHEQEHRRAGDVRLLLAGALLVAAVPWNPVAWWQLGRMHRALELDCDARVLRRTRDRAAYGRVLLEAGARSRAGHPLLAGFALRRPLLERRIEALFPTRPGRGWPALAGIAAVIALVVACAVPAPTEPSGADDVSTYRFTPSAADANTVRPRVVGSAGRFGAVATMRQGEPGSADGVGAPVEGGGGVIRLRETSSGVAGAAGVVREASTGEAPAAGVLRIRQRPEPR
jgi:bla regulator protein blaR1